jgi:hypothetical protein
MLGMYRGVTIADRSSARSAIRMVDYIAMNSAFWRVRAVCVVMVMSAVAVLGSAQSTVSIPRHGKLKALFNGKNLSGFDTFLEKHGANNDPDKVFQAENGVLHISGAEFGGIVTKKEYGNYYLRAEFKWGEKMYAPRLGKARDSGIQFHITGPLEVWPRMMEFQVSEGNTGDLWLIKGPALEVDGKRYQSTAESGPDQYIRLPRIGRGPLQNVTGFRQPAGEVENAQGEWNVLELVADHDRVVLYVNGKLVNQGTNSNTTHGKIDFESEGAEVYFRHMALASLKKTPAGKNH